MHSLEKTAGVIFNSVNDFAGPKFHPCSDLLKSSPSTGKIGTGAGNTSPAGIKCLV